MNFNPGVENVLANCDLPETVLFKQNTAMKMKSMFLSPYLVLVMAAAMSNKRKKNIKVVNIYSNQPLTRKHWS